MNRFLVFLLCCIVAVGLSSCFGPDKPDEKVLYEGVSFDYPSYWKAETERLEEDHFFIECVEKFNKETIFIVSFFSFEDDVEELLDGFFENLESGMDVTMEPRQTGKFGQYDCVYNKYKMSQLMSSFYGEAYAFNAEGKMLLVIKQSDKKYNLKHEKYKKIENSFRIEKQETDTLSN